MTPEQAEARFVIGTLCEACDAIEAQALDVDAVRLWVDGEPAVMGEETNGEQAFAVVFAEVRPTLGKQLFPNGVPDLLAQQKKENPDG